MRFCISVNSLRLFLPDPALFSVESCRIQGKERPLRVLSATHQKMLTTKGNIVPSGPSFTEPVMALPGQHLHEDARTQHHGRIAEYIIVGAFTAIMATFEWVRSWTELPPQPVAVSFLAAGLILYASARIYLIARKLKALNAARDGKKRLDSHLQQLGDRGYYAFDGIIDNYGLALGSVLVGPGGLFILEVKTVHPVGLASRPDRATHSGNAVHRRTPSHRQPTPTG